MTTVHLSALIDHMRASGHPAAAILAVVEGELNRDREQLDSWMDEEERRAEYERTHGQPVAF